jgi:hypothetical protein
MPNGRTFPAPAKDGEGRSQGIGVCAKPSELKAGKGTVSNATI